MKVLLFTGAGASVELGVPAMRRMAEQFRDHLHDLSLPDDVIDKIDRLVGNESKDMEHAIDVIHRLEGGFRARQEIGENPDEAEIAPYRIIRQEAEWFVQHCCEQIKTEAAIRMWSPTLCAATGIELSIATMNYDRAIEIAAARLSLNIEDGFEDFGEKELAQWRGLEKGEEISLYKLHGSTDWYRTASEKVYKLRHPMPLFGKLKIAPDELEGDPLHSALVLPSLEKAIRNAPFQQIAAEFRQRAKESDVAVFLGSSLRDPDMRDVCETCADSKPTFVVSRSGDFSEDVLPKNAAVIRQGAGRFLITTFPKFLQDKDHAVLTDSSNSSEPDRTRVLDWLSTAYDTNQSEQARCEAIETLANAHIALHSQEIQDLLDSESDDVSTYGLGLVLTSYDKDKLIEHAKKIAASNPDSKLASELKTLQELLDSNEG